MRLRRRPPKAIESPADLLDTAYDERLRALERIRTAAASVHASRARLESSRRSWVASVERHEATAAAALAAGDETAARTAAARCVPIDADIAAATEQLERYVEAERNLAVARDLVAEQLNTLRRRRDSVRGGRATAEALDSVRADLAALARDYEPVERALERGDA